MDSGHDNILVRPPEVAPKEDFDQLYQQIKALSPEDKANFLVHDIGNMSGTIQMIPVRACPEMANKVLSDFSVVAREFNAKRPEVEKGIPEELRNPNSLGVNALPIVDLYVNKGKECVKETIQAFSDSNDKISQLKIKQLEALAKHLDITRASVVFMQDPSELHFKVMDILHTDLRSMASLFVKDINNPKSLEMLAQIPEHDLTGPEAVIIFNIMHNAQRHEVRGTQTTIGLTAKGDPFVANESVTPLPEKNALKEPGENGHSGFGVYISRMLAAKKGLTINSKQELLPNGNYLINVSLEK